MSDNKFMHGKRLPSQTSLAEYYEFVNMANADDYDASAKWTPAVQLDLFRHAPGMTGRIARLRERG